jgi:Phage tail lysozyme
MTQARLVALVKELDPEFESLVGGKPEDRAAIWGQVEQESNADPAAIERPGTNLGGVDLWQHTGPRRRAYEAFAAAAGKPWQDARTQMRFVAQELKTIYAHAWNQICNVATTLQSKVETAMGLFEAPASWQQEIKNPGSTIAGLPRRLQGAQWALSAINQLKGKPPVTDTSGTTTTQPTPTVASNVLADWIKKNEVPAETVIRQLLVAKGVPGFIVDLIFSALNPIIDQMVSNIHPEDIGNLIAQHVINPLLTNLNLPKRTG